MAALPDAERVAAWQLYMDETELAEVFSLHKADLRAAINAVDDWTEANMSSFNAALPQPARSALSTRQKSRLLVTVVRQRFQLDV